MCSYPVMYSFYSTVTSLNHQDLDKDQTSKKKKTKNDDLRLPIFVKLMWFLQYHQYSGLLITTITRWAIDTGEPYQFSTNAIDIQHHGIGIVLLTLDFLLIATPFRLQHIFYGMIGPTLYILFTVIYYFAGGTNPHHLYKEINGDTYIYLGKLDWGTIPVTSTIVSVMIIFVGFPGVHCFYYLLQKLRDTCIEWYYFKKETEHV